MLSKFGGGDLERLQLRADSFDDRRQVEDYCELLELAPLEYVNVTKDRVSLCDVEHSRLYKLERKRDNQWAGYGPRTSIFAGSSPPANFKRDDLQEAIDLIVTDPPYGIDYFSNYYKDENPFSPLEGHSEFQFEWLQEAHRVLIDGGAIYCFTVESVYPAWKEAIEDAGFEFKRMLVWLKNNWGMGDLQGNYIS
ncbi:DNA methyltransferase [Natrinema soli]|uniref:Type II methyltransferase n=2 Tax=Natrinema soli TaxID=1930624 RepID=A0ABD5SIQ1_9EURY